MPAVLDASARVRPATPADAEAWVACYLDALELAYAVLMPPEFAPLHRGRSDELVAEKREAFSRYADGGSRGWLVEDDERVVAVAEAGPGPGGWEQGRGLPPPPATLELHKLYAVPSAHGTGAGQALLDAALGDEPAYLWLVEGNERAAAFYRRNGFRPDGVVTLGGPSWFGRVMVRLHRP